MVNQISVRLCAMINGCGDLAHRLPATGVIFSCAVIACVAIFLLSAIHGWRPVAFSAGLVALTDIILYLRLDVAQWPQGDAEMTTFFSFTSLIFLLPAEKGLIRRAPHFKRCLRLITPVLSVCFALLLLLSTHAGA